METIEMKSYHPEAIILVNVSDRDDYYLESAKLSVRNGKLSPGAFTSLSKELMVKIAENVSREVTKFTYNALEKNNLISFNLRGNLLDVIWMVPASQQNLLFDKKINLENGSYPLPTLIFSYKDGDMSVYAIKDEEVTSDTELFLAPFGNVYNDNTVCWGTVKTKFDMANINKAISQWENLFFNSHFTHTVKENIVKGNVITLFKNIKGKNVFPKSVLIKADMTIKDLL